MDACTNLAEKCVGAYSNVSLHFVFTKLFHQIIHYLIFGGMGQFVMKERRREEEAQTTILRLDTWAVLY